MRDKPRNTKFFTQLSSIIALHFEEERTTVPHNLFWKFTTFYTDTKTTSKANATGDKISAHDAMTCFILASTVENTDTKMLTIFWKVQLCWLQGWLI